MIAVMDAHATSDARLFERLCLLRALYGRRTNRDRMAIMSVADAVRYAEVLLAAGTPPAAERPA